MARAVFQELVSSRPWLLADGATGTSLFACGLMSGDAPELWNELHPERIADLHRGFVDAGADLFLTNSLVATAIDSSCTSPSTGPPRSTGVPRRSRGPSPMPPTGR